MSIDYTNYLIYALGYFSIAYVFLIILRHAIIYYIVKTLMGIMKIVTKKDFKYSPKSEPLTEREDELKRDQKVEIFKQQASEIRKAFDKKKNDDGIIEVDIQRTGGETSQGQGGAFAENSSRLSETRQRQNERIVGIVDQNSLPKWQKMVFQKMFTELNQIASIMVQNRVSSSQTTGYWSSYVAAKQQSAVKNSGHTRGF